MKNLACVIFAAIALTGKSDLAQNVTVVKLTPEQLAVRRAAAHKRQMEKFGGWVLDRRNMEGWISIVNAQEAIGVPVLMSAGKKIASMVKIDIRMTNITVKALKDFDRTLSELNANLAVFVIDDENLPGLLLAPEQKWSAVNVAKYKGKVQDDWVRVEIMRALCYVSGAGVLPDPTTIMAPVTTPEKLAYINPNRVPFETCMNMINSLRLYGITQYERCKYEDACKGGWAPAPTNEFQKAVWERVHAIPDKPLKIEFDPATQKGKVTK